jgi:hypothetical protein
MPKECLKPAGNSVYTARAQKFDLEMPIYLFDLLKGNFLQVKSQYFCHFADNKGRIDSSNQRFMRNPLLHGFHGDSIDIVPVFDLLVGEVFIMQCRAFEGESIGKYASSFI